MTDSIIKGIMKGLGEISQETAETGVKETVNIGQSVISGQELLGGIKKIDEAEMGKMEKSEEVEKQEEMDRLRKVAASQGRKLEEELQEIRNQKQEKEKREEEEFLEKIRLQREAEVREREELLEEPGNVKREAAKTQFAPGKRKKQAPDPTQMSQTSEFKGGKID